MNLLTLIYLNTIHSNPFQLEIPLEFEKWDVIICSFCVFISVDRTKEMLGTFSPQVEPYTYETPEEITPCGIFARGTYSARTKVSSIHSVTSYFLLTREIGWPETEGQWSQSKYRQGFLIVILITDDIFLIFILITDGIFHLSHQFVDDDGKCYLEINYTFDIRREWLPISWYSSVEICKNPRTKELINEDISLSVFHFLSFNHLMVCLV